MTLGSLDYAVSYFKYKSPTPIHAAPIDKALKRLKAELRANASSVEADLGGGDFGYLDLVLTDAEYTSMETHPPWFDAPNYPIPLQIPPGASQVDAFTIHHIHTEQTRKYYECKNVEKALQRHIQDAIEDMYLETLMNEDTQLFQEDISTVLAYPFATYGEVPTVEVKEQENEICSMTFHPANLLIMVYGPIEKLQKVARAAQISYTPKQILDIGITVIKNTRYFERTLMDW